MDPANIRRIAITAIFSDELLLELLVLKGGNALDLVHGLAARASYDLDFSIEGDFSDVDDIARRLFRALRDRFDAVGMLVFDERFEPQPKSRRPGLDDRWGGYKAEFKLMPVTSAAALGHDLGAMRRQSTVLSSSNGRVFKIEISKCEHVDGKVELELDAFPVVAYSTEMIVAEKLRAICQQMPGYEMNTHRHGRARDFYDIYGAVNRGKLDLSSSQNLRLIRAMFAAKDVPLQFLPRIRDYREFHRTDWPSVLQMVAEPAMDFDVYFDFVVELVSKLEVLWNE
jgi:hypothetical protein